MRANIPERMTEPVTIAHRLSPTLDAWETTTYPACNWQERRSRLVAADGTIQNVDTLIVQIPEDMGVVAVEMGDYLIRGEYAFQGTTRELVEWLPEGSKKVSRFRDLRGGLSGIRGGVLRYASSLVVEGE